MQKKKKLIAKFARKDRNTGTLFWPDTVDAGIITGDEVITILSHSI